MKKNTTHNLTVAAMLSAVAFILMFIEFPLPMLIPSFVKMDFSDLPALLGAFALGPVYGVVISFMKNLLHIIIKGTSTACVGELCNFMLGAVFSAVAGFVYKRHKSRKTAILGAIAGAAAMAVFSVPSNYFITYPAYVQFYHMPLEAILGMYQAILPSADSLIKCLVIFNMPFTLVKGLLDAVLCLLIYKPLSPILHGRKYAAETREPESPRTFRLFLCLEGGPLDLPLPSCRFASSHLPQGDGLWLCRKVSLLGKGVPLGELAR